MPEINWKPYRIGYQHAYQAVMWALENGFTSWVYTTWVNTTEEILNTHENRIAYSGAIHGTNMAVRDFGKIRTVYNYRSTS